MKVEGVGVMKDQELNIDEIEVSLTVGWVGKVVSREDWIGEIVGSQDVKYLCCYPRTSPADQESGPLDRH